MNSLDNLANIFVPLSFTHHLKFDGKHFVSILPRHLHKEILPTTIRSKIVSNKKNFAGVYSLLLILPHFLTLPRKNDSTGTRIGSPCQSLAHKNKAPTALPFNHAPRPSNVPSTQTLLHLHFANYRYFNFTKL